MAEERDEVISDQQEISEEKEQDSGLEAQPEESLSAGESEIPEKFRGKSAVDVIDSYLELEKHLGQISSQRAQEQKEKEELERRMAELERTYQSTPTQQQPQVTEQRVEDPLSSFDERFEEDPKGAIKTFFKQQQEHLEQQSKKSLMQQRADAAREYYNKRAVEDQDYARREKAMLDIAKQYNHIIKSDYAQSKELLQLLDLASKGNDLKYYQEAAIERAKKDGLSVRDEKRRAQSESSNSQGDQRVKFSQLSMEEMEEALGYSDE
jgi:hypothetical protein